MPMIMMKFRTILFFILAIVAVSCSKSDDDSVDSFFKINGINADEFPEWAGWVNENNSSSVKYIYASFSNITDELYFWLCDEERKVICKSTINLPKQIVEDQGFGNLVTCERINNYYVAIKFISAIDNIELYYFSPSYENMKNNFSYLIIYKDRKIYTHKLEKAVSYQFELLQWYNNSLLLGEYSSDYCFCISRDGEKVTMIEDNGKARLRNIFEKDTYHIPLDYTKCIILSCSKLTEKEMGFYIYLESFDKGERLSFTAPSPFDPSEKFIT